MPWVYSHGSGTPPSWTWSAVNTLNQHCDNISIPSGSAITQLKVYASARSSNVSTRLVLWASGGSALKQTSTFTMSVGSESAGGQYWYTKTISAYKVSSTTTFWVGLYRNPSGGHIMGTTATGGGTAYRKTNTSGFPNVYSMSGYSSQSKGAYVGAFYIQAPSNQSSCSVSRVSDSKQNVSWTNNATTDRPYSSIKIQRWDNVTNSWYAKATLSGGTSSYTDSTTTSNRYYRYRIIAYNDAGNSSYVYSGYINTTPSAPSSVSAVRSGSSIIITWNDNSTNEDNFEIARRGSNDGGASWSAWDYSLSDVGAGVETKTDTSPSHTTMEYAVRSKETTDTLYSAWAYSNSVVVLSPPNAPTNLTEDVDPLDATEQVVLSWQHNTTDETSQTKYSVQYRIQGDAWPSTPQYDEITSTVSSLTIPAGTLTNGEVYEWQVKTWGSYSTGSSFSNSEELQTVTRPVAVITQPSSTVDYAESELTVYWSFTQAESNGQESYSIELYNSSNELIADDYQEQVIQDGEIGNHIFVTLLDDASTYTVKLTVTDLESQSSDETEVTFDTAFATPPVPTFTLDKDASNGSVLIDITNPTAGAGEVNADANNIYWSLDGITYIKVLENVPTNTVITHYTPNLGDLENYYYVESVSSVPTYRQSSVDTIVLNYIGFYFFNTGDGLSDYIKMIGDIKITEIVERENKPIQFEGRQLPLRYIGTHYLQNLSFGCDLPIADYETMKSIVLSTSDIYYRDYNNRVFRCILINPSFNKIDRGYAYSFTCTIIREADNGYT